MSEHMTAAQLDALPTGTTMVDSFNDRLTKHDDGLWHSFETAPMWAAKVAKWGPFRDVEAPR